MARLRFALLPLPLLPSRGTATADRVFAAVLRSVADALFGVIRVRWPAAPVVLLLLLLADGRVADA